MSRFEFLLCRANLDVGVERYRIVALRERIDELEQLIGRPDS